MPDISDPTKLSLLLFFIVPGFVASKLYGIIFPSAHRNTSDVVVDIIVYSFISYAAMALPIYAVETSSLRAVHPLLYIIFYLNVMLFVPIILVFVTKWLRRSSLVANVLPHPMGAAWDYVFAEGQRFWVVVTLNDGTKIAGQYGYKSFASSAPSRQELYLEEAWHLSASNGFERPKTGTKGVFVSAGSIRTVEFYET